MPPRLHVVVASTRPGRLGSSVASWFQSFAAAQGAFDAHLVDLADYQLPLYDEPNHPRLRKYSRPHTVRWSETVIQADAHVFVTPEYNYGPTPALINALNYVFHEWHYTPAAFVSYGGVSGGLRAVQAVRLMLPGLKIMGLSEGVVAPMVATQIKDGVFAPSDLQVQGAQELLSELARWTAALQALRVAKRATLTEAGA